MDEKEIHESFKVLTEISAKIEQEIGACVCGNHENLYFDDILTIGTPQRGIIVCTCNPVQKLFHTHPLGTPHPSKEDIETLTKTNLNQGEYCIGSITNGKPQVECYNITKLKRKTI